MSVESDLNIILMESHMISPAKIRSAISMGVVAIHVFTESVMGFV